MYSRKERMRAIGLYTKYDRCAADATRELGDPRPRCAPYPLETAAAEHWNPTCMLSWMSAVVSLVMPYAYQVK